MHKRGFFAVVAVSMMLVASCGGGSSELTAPNTPKQIAADKALAKQAVLRASDLPAGYKATPHDNSSSNGDLPPAAAKKFAACAHVPKSEIESLFNDDHKPDQPAVDSPDFSLTDADTGFQTSFQNNVELDRSSNDIKEPLALLGAESALKCWKDLFQTAFDDTAPPGASFHDLAVVSLPTDSIGGDQSAAFEARVVLTQGTRSVKAYLDFYLVRRGRAGVSLLASGIGERVPPVLERSLANAVVDRLDDAA